MKKEIPVILSYKSKNYNPKNKSLTNHFPLITDLNSYSLFNTNSKIQTKSTNEITYTKNVNTNLKNYSHSKISKNDNSNKLFHVFKPSKEKQKNKLIWPKITHSKLPFSKREKISDEERIKQFREQKPNRIYHDFAMIKWLRNKYSDSLIEKSVFSMLPDNGKPVVPEDESEGEKKHRLLMEFLDSLYKRVPEREKHVNINPKYFFDQKTFQKILKFKEIFLEFDEDQSRKMEIDEMVEMFNQNHIKASLEDLRNLFFKDKRVKKEDIMKLYLDFYQFMNFALTKDQDFREFMREVKARRKKNEKNTLDKNEDEFDEDKEGYLPMNFNLMFDYFLIKGKERASYEEIENSIKEMDKIINHNNDPNYDDEKENEKGKINKNKKSRKNLSELNDSINKNKSNEENKDININYEDQLKKLNFVKLIENFTTLFHINDSTSSKGKGMSDSFNELITSHEQTSGIKNIKLKENNNIQTSMFTEKDITNKDNNNKKLKRKLSSSTSLDNKTFEKFVEYDINRKTLKNLNMNNYKKLHNVNLALTETQKEVNNFIKSHKNKKINDKNHLYINDYSLINININPKLNYLSSNKEKYKALKLNPSFIFDKSNKFISKHYSNSVKINPTLNSKDINNFKNKNNCKSEISSIKSFMSKVRNINIKYKNKLDYVPPELLKQQKNRRFFKFYI